MRNSKKTYSMRGQKRVIMNPKNSRSSRNFWHICKILPGDYKDYGGLVEKGREFGKAYNDCSCGCKWFMELYAGDDSKCPYDLDWGVCVNPKSHRAGLLTFEHQAGFGCHEYTTRG